MRYLYWLPLLAGFTNAGLTSRFDREACFTCLDTIQECTDAVNDAAESCQDACEGLPPIGPLTDCIFDCVDEQRDGLAECNLNSCLCSVCELDYDCAIQATHTYPSATADPTDSEPTTESTAPTDTLTSPNDTPSDTNTAPITAPTSVECKRAGDGDTCPAPTPPQCEFDQKLSLRCGYSTISQTCADQKMILRQGPIGKPNGCGSSGNYFQDLIHAGLDIVATEFRACCNRHDDCWGQCSFGDDSLFDYCNGQFFSCMIDVCNLQYRQTKGILSGSLLGVCLNKAVDIAGAVEIGGCGPYDAAQSSACICGPCDSDDGSDGPGKIVVHTPSDTIASTCAIASSIGAQWSLFQSALNTALSVASSDDRVFLGYYAGVIGADTNRSTASDQITDLAASCGQKQRRHETPHRPRTPWRRDSPRLSTFFSSVENTDLSAYTCGGRAGDLVCQVSLALISMAELSRSIESYADDTPRSIITEAPSSSSSSNLSTSSSSTMTSSVVSTTEQSSSLSSVQMAPSTGSSTLSYTSRTAVPTTLTSSLTSSLAPQIPPSLDSTPSNSSTSYISASSQSLILPSSAALSQQTIQSSNQSDSTTSRSDSLSSPATTLPISCSRCATSTTDTAPQLSFPPAASSSSDVASGLNSLSTSSETPDVGTMSSSAFDSPSVDTSWTPPATATGISLHTSQSIVTRSMSSVPADFPTALSASISMIGISTLDKVSPTVNVESSSKVSFTSSLPSSPNATRPRAFVLHPNGRRDKCLDLSGNVRQNGSLVQMFV
ncbi:hypothetical protein IAT40_003428 [Kwoniella sp. CBS 6097]